MSDEQILYFEHTWHKYISRKWCARNETLP